MSADVLADATAMEGIPNVPFSFVVEVAKHCVAVLMALAFLDYFFARQWQGRYFILHTAVNAAITVAVLPDVFHLVTDPISTLRLTSCWAFPTGACFAIHFYHMLAPGFVLYSVDWLHHILMVVLGCPAIIAGQVGPLMNFNYFFICGLPGGIDYLMLALVKERLMLPLTEKKHNNTIQVWVRGPALVIIAALCWMQLYIQQEHFGSVPLHLVAVRLFCIALNYWNGLYFMQRVCGNYFVTRYKLKEEYVRSKKQDGVDGGGAAGAKNRRDMSRVAAAKDLKENVLEDDIDEHPVESVVPGMSRSVKFGRKGADLFWNIVRGGS